MTKKIFAMFLAVLMVVSMLPTSVFAAENGCPGETVAHSLKNCTTYKAVAVKEANCGEGGYTTYLCTECGRTFIDSRTEKFGEHDYSKAAEDVEPTCTDKGSKGGLECTKCGDVIGAEEVPPLGEGLSHEWGEWNATEFDCTKDFEMERKCLHCSAVYTETYEAADDADHDFGAWEKVEGTNTARRYCTNKHEGLWKCNAYEETTIVAAHIHDENTLLYVAKVNEQCEVAGVKAHYECRECGKLFEKKSGEYVETTLADLNIKSKHQDLKDRLTCTSTTKQCPTCKEVVKVSAADAHSYNKWVVVTKPGCLTDGFEKRTCKHCANTETRIIEPLGHELVTVEVDATCVAFAYSYTFCTRCSAGVEVELPEDHDAAEYAMKEHVLAPILAAPADGSSFYLALNQRNDYVQLPLYFAGAMDGYYLATTSDYQKATEVFVEVVDGGYLLYFLEGEEKTYIEIYEYEEGKVGVHLTAEPENVFTWNTNNSVLTTTIDGTEYYLGTYNTFTTISASKISYIGTSYAAKLSAIDSFVAAKVVEYTIGTELDADGHTMKDYYRYPATCLATGLLVEECVKCHYVTDEQTLPLVDHTYVEDKTEATCTTAGKLVKTCSVVGCGHTVEEEIPALGHTPAVYPEGHEKEGQIVVGTTEADHLHTMINDYYTCAREDCGVTYNKHNFRLWDEASMIFDLKTDAETAHMCDGVDVYLEYVKTVAGDCETDGYEVYTCTGCGNNVKVKIANTGSHSAPIMTETADCVNPGGYYNYVCTFCNELVNKDYEEGEFVQTEAALGHDWKENENYVASSCDAPNMDEETNYSRYCDRCDIKDHDYEVLYVKELGVGEYLCTSYTYIVYSCEEHGSHSYNFVGNYGHVYELVEDSTDPATCTDDGSYKEKCKYCGDEQTRKIPMIQHENAAGEKFWSDCLPEEMDRHCVLCCECMDEDGNLTHENTCVNPDGDDETEDACDCVIEAGQHDYDVITVLPTCDAMPYHYEMCTKCYDTTKAVFDTEAFVGLNADGSKKYIDVVLGHRPVEAGSDKYYGYVYMEFGPYVDYVYVGDVLTAVPMPAYDAMYIEYKAPTRTEAGYEKYECAVCGEIHEKVLEVNTEVEFNAEIQEGDYTYGSVVEVVITVDGSSQKMDSFTFVVNATNMVYIGCDATINLDFAVDATVKKDGTVVVTGWNGENVAIDGEIELIKLQFRVNANENKEENIAVSMTQFESFEMATYLNEEGKPTAFNAAFTGDKADTRMLMDVDGNSTVTFRDVVYLSQMVQNGEYDVVCDINGNGEIDLQDLVEARQLYVGNVTAEELAVKYLGAEMAKLMGINVCEDCGAVDCTEKHTA